jgi:Glyoxalase-like domain
MAFRSWEEFARSAGIPEEEFGEVSSRIDPAGEGPLLYFQRVPEGKTAKNRVHLDIRVAGREVRGEERKRLVSEKVERLVQAGASIAWANETIRGDSIVMRDPEGNEFCVS